MLAGCAAAVLAFAGSAGDTDLQQCCQNNCPDMHGQAPAPGATLTVGNKADGGTYSPGEQLTLANTGGREYALYAMVGPTGPALGRADNGQLIVTAPNAGELLLLGMSAAGRNQVTYELITLTSDGTAAPETSPPGPNTPPGVAASPPPPAGGGGGVDGGGGAISTGGSSSSTDVIPDAGTGLLYMVFGIMLAHVLQRHGRKLFKGQTRAQLVKQHQQALASSVVNVPPPPPGQQKVPPPPGSWGTPPPPSQPPSGLPPPPPPPPSPPEDGWLGNTFKDGWPTPPPSPPPPPPPPAAGSDPSSEWIPQLDESGYQYFWNTRTNAVQWEAPGLPPPPPAPAAGAPPPPAHDFGAQQGFGMALAEVEVEIVPSLPAVGQRKATISVPKEFKAMSARKAKYTTLANKRFKLLDASCIEVLLFALYALINVAWCTVFAKSEWYRADQWGYLASANGLFVVIPASRHSLWGWLLGLPFDKTITFHRWVGRLVFVEATLHMAEYFNDEYLRDFGSMLDYDKYKNGFVSWLALLVVFCTSIEWLRRKRYEVFYALHFAFLLFYLFAALHTPKFKFYGFLAMAIYGVDKLQRLARGYVSTRPVDRVEAVAGGEILRVSIAKPRWSRPQLGQYVFLQFPEISKWEWHPYTLASSPLETHYEVDIKRLGDHTGKLLKAYQTGARPVVRIDGPYGRVIINPRRYRSLAFVCGGIGVTPMISMLRWYYLINTPQEIADQQTVHLAEYIYFVWVVDQRSTYDVFKSTILACVERSKQPGFPTFVPIIHVTREAAPEAAHFGLAPQYLFTGRPEIKSILTNIKQNGILRHAVYYCGPRPLCNATWQATSELSDEKVMFAFHHETFEF